MALSQSARPPKRRAAATLDELGGAASGRVDFVRSDARAVKRTAPSNSQLKSALASPFEMAGGLAGPTAAHVLRELVASCAGDAAGRVQPGVVVGLGAVGRRLRRGELSALVVAREAMPPLLLAHVPVLAAQRGVPLCVLACSSAQLGQRFGLLRAAAVGLEARLFAADHALVRLLAKSAIATPAWVERALDAARRREGEPVEGKDESTVRDDTHANRAGSG